MNPVTGDNEIADAINSGKLKPSPQILALLQELKDMLDALAGHGTENRIDIRSLPLLPDEHTFLSAFLGEGEVTARINALGLSKIKETRFSGIWWITHYNTCEEIVAELIEVTLLPDILKTQAPDLHHGIDAFHSYLHKLQSVS